MGGSGGEGVLLAPLLCLLLLLCFQFPHTGCVVLCLKKLCNRFYRVAIESSGRSVAASEQRAGRLLGQPS